MLTANSLQLCPTLCDPIDGSPPGSPVPGILQARTLEWVAISFSIAWKWKVKVKSFSRIRLLATPWTAAYQAPPSMGFSRQEYWSGVPLLSPCVQPVGYECKNCLPRVSLILCALILTIFSLIYLGNIIQYSHSKKVTRLCKSYTGPLLFNPLGNPSFYCFLIVVVQSLSHIQLFVTPWTAACQASLSFTISQSLLKLKSIESMMSSNHLILCCLLLLLPWVFPSIRVFSLSLLFVSQVAKVSELQLQH